MEEYQSGVYNEDILTKERLDDQIKILLNLKTYLKILKMTIMMMLLIIKLIVFQH